MTYTLASACSGFGGLDLAVEAVLGPARHLWHAEYDPGDPEKNPKNWNPYWKAPILAAHWPGVPNLGDLSQVNWPKVSRPDVLTAGFPCTDISCAGRQAGMGAGTRSGVWSHIAAALAVLRPRLVVIENVEALLSTDAQRTTDGTDGHLEPGPAGLGNGADRPVLRALGAVLGDLATLGFDAEWASVAASDVGACHRRRRVFILAWPADSEGVGQWYARAQGGGGVASTAVSGGVGADRLNLLPTPAARLGDERGMPSAGLAADRYDSGRRNLEDAVALLPTPTARDGDGRGEGSHDYWDRKREAGWAKGLPLGAAVTLLPTPMSTDAKGARNATSGRTDPKASTQTNGWTLSDVAYSDRWGRYAPAIRRWEHTLGRPAPEPTEAGTKGQPRLSPSFVEFLMGLPNGWVTDHVGRNAALMALGDGVVPQQAAYALRLLLNAANREQVAA